MRRLGAAYLRLCWTAFLTGTLAASGCSSPPARTAPLARSADPRWQDVFEPTPDLVLVLHPRGLRRDALYGPLLRRAIELARQESAIVSATRALDAVEDADEVVVGARDVRGDAARDRSSQRTAESDDLILVVRGVRADLDPANLVDERGMPLWSPGPAGAVRELVLAQAARRDGLYDASLFELPERTWVIATGKRRHRARQVFANPGSSPARHSFEVDGDLESPSLAAAELSGPSLVAHFPALRAPAQLAPIGHELAAMRLTLAPGVDAVLRATLTYEDSAATAPAEAALRHALVVLSRPKPNDSAWLRNGAASATVTRRGRQVVVTAPLPGDLLSALRLPGADVRGEGPD